MKYIIQDWAGNIVDFKGRVERPEFAAPMEFTHFDEASDWLADKFGHLSDEEYEAVVGEFFILERGAK